jgi:hypothetical protein
MVPEYWTGTTWMAQGDFVTYTPAWTASLVNPILGNGGLISRWSRVGRQITWMGSLILGSTSSGGDGLWGMSAPVQAAANGVSIQLGVAEYLNSGDGEYLGVVQLGGGSSTAGFRVKTSSSSQSSGTVSNTVPVNASSNSQVHWSITYEALT